MSDGGRATIATRDSAIVAADASDGGGTTIATRDSAIVVDAGVQDAVDAGNADAGLACGAVAFPSPTEPRTSSFHDCARYGCDFGEACDFTVYDLLCPSGPCGGEQTGDQLCHRVCSDGACSPGEHCEMRPVYVSDTPTQYEMLCICDDAICPTRGLDALDRPPEGGIELWRDEAPMPMDLYYHAAAATDAWLLVSGGLTIDELGPGGGSATLQREASVVAAPIGADGALGDWITSGTLPEPRLNHAMVIVDERLYVAGGQIDSSFSASVISAPIAADGTLGVWRDEASLPGVRAHHVLAAEGRTLYVAAGSQSSAFFTDGTTELWIGTLDSSGAVTGWSTVNAPEPVHYEGGAVLADGRLYVVDEQGGIRHQSLDRLTDSSTWVSETGPLGQHVDFASSGQHTLRAVPLCDGLLFLVPGGRTATAPLKADGSLGDWLVASRIYGTGTGFAIATSPTERVYVTGGTSGSTPIERVDGVWSTARL